jgi:hypothetical protein
MARHWSTYVSCVRTVRCDFETWRSGIGDTLSSRLDRRTGSGLMWRVSVRNCAARVTLSFKKKIPQSNNNSESPVYGVLCIILHRASLLVNQFAFDELYANRVFKFSSARTQSNRESRVKTCMWDKYNNLKSVMKIGCNLLNLWQVIKTKARRQYILGFVPALDCLDNIYSRRRKKNLRNQGKAGHQVLTNTSNKPKPEPVIAYLLLTYWNAESFRSGIQVHFQSWS